jgi:hypothetical protein
VPDSFKARRRDANQVAIPPRARDDDDQEIPQAAAERAVFRNFDDAYFYPPESWESLRGILATEGGGAFGVYGPRGSGKSWLMRKAINEVERCGGLGLWFPCPSRYDAAEFLSTLSDTLANVVELRLAGRASVLSVLRQSRNILAAIAAVLLLCTVLLYSVLGLSAQTSRSPSGRPSALAFPDWIWLGAGAAAALALIVSAIQLMYGSTARSHLLRQATALRERIRFTESLKLGAGLGVSGGKGLAASFSRSRVRTLNERPTSVASLVFELRNLAGSIVTALHHSLVVCIDELDKIDDTAEVLALLRDIKGIFGVHGTHFLVSLSEEAASSLQIGTLRSGGRNEFNSSFDSIVALPPLKAPEARELLCGRDLEPSMRLVRALCMLAGGNRRELVRMADACAGYARMQHRTLDEQRIIELLAEESLALLNEITRELPGPAYPAAEDEVKYQAWMAIPREAFETPAEFVKMGKSAIQQYWEPPWVSEDWSAVRESWRRLLIRLFVAARALPRPQSTTTPCLLDDASASDSLQDILMMATRDSSVARLMLMSRFGSDLSERFNLPAARNG